MKDSDLRFNLLTAAALGAVIVLSHGTARAMDQATGLYIRAGVGQSDVDSSRGVTGAVATGRDTTNIGWKVYPGYRFNKWLALEEGHNASPGRPAGVLVAVGTLSDGAEDIASEVWRQAGAVGIEYARGMWESGEWKDFDPVAPTQLVDEKAS